MRALLLLSFIAASVAQAKPEYRMGMSTSLYREQKDIELILAVLALPDYGGLAGGVLEQTCRESVVTELLPYAAGRRRIIGFVNMDQTNFFPGKYGPEIKDSHRILVTFRDENGISTDKEFICPRIPGRRDDSDETIKSLKLWQLVKSVDYFEGPTLEEREDGEHLTIDPAYSSVKFEEQSEIETFLARLTSPYYYTQTDKLLNETCRKKLVVDLLPYAAGRRKIVKAETQELIGPVPGHIYGTRKGEIHLIALTLEDENKVQTQVSLSCQRGRAVHPGLSTKSTNEALSYLKLWDLKKDGPMDTKAQLIERPHAP